MDESLGMRRGKESTKKQTMGGRRDESKGETKSHEKMEKKTGKKIAKHLKEDMKEARTGIKRDKTLMKAAKKCK